MSGVRAASKATQNSVIAKVTADTNRILQAPDTRERLAGFGSQLDTVVGR